MRPTVAALYERRNSKTAPKSARSCVRAVSDLFRRRLHTKPSQRSGKRQQFTKLFCVSAKKALRMEPGSAHTIMPDHLRLFVATDDEQIAISAWMKSLKNAISKTLRENGVTAPHSQKTFFDHLLRSSESYSEKWNYVRQNPVRAGLVTGAEDWPYVGEIFALEYRSEK